MALRAQVTGAITTPELRWTPEQQPRLGFRVNATLSTRNKSTNQWEDVGAPLWVSVTFWDRDAQTLNDMLGKGDRITVEGTLVVESYQRRDGTEGTSLSLRYPKFLGVISKGRSSGPATGSVPAITDVHAPAPHGTHPDPWTDDHGSTLDDAPF